MQIGAQTSSSSCSAQPPRCWARSRSAAATWSTPDLTVSTLGGPTPAAERRPARWRPLRPPPLGPFGARQLAKVPSKPMVRCVPSQKGLLAECPQRHSANCGGWGISRPSGAVRWIGPETRYGPFSLGVMVTSSINQCCPFELVDLDRSGYRQPPDAGTGECEDCVGQRRRNSRDADLADTARRLG